MIAADSIGTQSLEAAPQRATPERELWCAVLERAVEDVRTSRLMHWRARPSIKREVLEWLRSKDETEGSFRFVCDVLNVSPSAARRAILQAQQRG
jgi:hypothetical protein